MCVTQALEWDRPFNERVPVASSNLQALGVLVREVAVIVVGVSVALGADASGSAGSSLPRPWERWRRSSVDHGGWH